jgi:small GTP-binding protein
LFEAIRFIVFFESHFDRSEFLFSNLRSTLKNRETLPLILQMNCEVIDLKVVVLGAAGVGKTCIINRICNETFLGSTLPTIGAGFFPYFTHLEGTEIRVMLWDTAGEERFRSVTPALLHGADAMILVYDVARCDSLDALSTYLSMFMDTVPVAAAPILPVLVFGNKTDLEFHQIPERSARNWIEKQNIQHLKLVSAKTGAGLTDVLEDFIGYIISLRSEPSLTIAFHLPPQSNKESDGCPC